MFALHGPARVFPGQVVRYEVERIDGMQTDSITLAIRGRRGTKLGATELYAELATTYYGTGIRFPLDVVIWPFPSHVTPLAWSSLWLDAHGTVNARVVEAVFPLRVCEPLREHNPDPQVARTRQYVDLGIGLGATRVTGGMTLVGTCSIAGLTRDTHVELDVLCTVRATTGQVETIRMCSTKLKLPKHAADAGVPFTMALPTYLAPTLAIDTHRIEYLFQARHKHRGNSTVVALPLQVVDAFPSPARIRPPELGERKLEPVFADVASRAGWRIGPSVDPDPELGTIMPWIFAEHGGFVMRLGYAFRSDGSTFLICKVRYRPLELGLRVVVGHGGTTISSGVAEWDREHFATARDVPRATEMLKAVVPELAPLGTLVRWDDDWMIFEREVTDVDVKLVDEVANALRLVTQKLARAIRSDEIVMSPYR